MHATCFLDTGKTRDSLFSDTSKSMCHYLWNNLWLPRASIYHACVVVSSGKMGVAHHRCMHSAYPHHSVRSRNMAMENLPLSRRVICREMDGHLGFPIARHSLWLKSPISQVKSPKKCWRNPESCCLDHLYIPNMSFFLCWINPHITFGELPRMPTSPTS